MATENVTDREFADYFQAHKDDPEEWSDAEPAPEFVRKRKSRDLSMKIAVRFTLDEGALIRSEAARLKLPYSEVVRRAVQHLVPPHSATRRDRPNGAVQRASLTDTTLQGLHLQSSRSVGDCRKMLRPNGSSIMDSPSDPLGDS